MKQKVYSSYQWIPMFFMACSVACYIFSKIGMLIYTEWFHWFAMKTFECPTVLIIGLWIAAFKLKWRLITKLCLLNITAVAAADNFCLFTGKVHHYDCGIFWANAILIFVYALLTVMDKMKD